MNKFLLGLLSSLLLVVRSEHEAEKLPGWLGEVRNLISSNDEGGQAVAGESKDNMRESSVIDRKTGKSVASSVRTSTGRFLNIAYDDVVSRIERRVAEVTRVPIGNQESMQILRYVNGQEYKPHHDYFHDAPHINPKTGGQRLVTMLMYLSTPEEGGETVLPMGEPKVQGEGWSDCARKGLAVKAIKGNALMFFGLHPDNTPDPSSLHGSCPTTKGEKWSATKWIHVGSTRPSSEERKRWSKCNDKDAKCSEWAASGECRKNPNYMSANCALSCNTCQTAEDGEYDDEDNGHS